MADVFPDKMVVHEFSYKMNGITMGELFLLDSSRHNRPVAFLSTQTVAATTPWHGSWHGQFTEHLTCYFDYLGDPTKLRSNGHILNMILYGTCIAVTTTGDAVL